MSLAKKLQDAGVDTLGARFTNICLDVIREKPDNVIQAWINVGDRFGYEFIAALIRDMEWHTAVSPKYDQALKEQKPSTPSEVFNSPLAEPKPYAPHVIPKERLEERQKLEKLIQSKYITSSGINWAYVKWHELPGMKRDGAEAAALLEAGPANMPNGNPRVHEVLNIKKVDEVLWAVKKAGK